MNKSRIFKSTAFAVVFSMASFTAYADMHDHHMHESVEDYKAQEKEVHHKKHHARMHVNKMAETRANRKCLMNNQIGEGDHHAERLRDCREKMDDRIEKMKETWKEKHKRQKTW